MIVGELKPIEEIVTYLKGFKQVLVVGCNGCVSVCLSGGAKNADALIREINHPKYFGLEVPNFISSAILRQCEKDMVKNFLQIPKGTDAILSLACGAGVQTLVEVFGNLPIFPALNTTFLGSYEEPGVWEEKCRGCGACVLAYTGGICPIARCAKRLLNGPCGGSTNGKCEIREDVPCAWQLIIDRLKALNKLDLYMNIMGVKDWAKDRSGGPRSLKRAIPEI